MGKLSSGKYENDISMQFITIELESQKKNT